jgi:hypothetical protein
MAVKSDTCSAPQIYSSKEHYLLLGPFGRVPQTSFHSSAGDAARSIRLSRFPHGYDGGGLFTRVHGYCLIRK